ncbi:hypothetical protein, partial [Vibrio vulnificus]|uniref:hypothetical protein n=1 Tax=Vibrio vulnificus TaxID=672 RepID=UPI0039B57F45
IAQSNHAALLFRTGLVKGLGPPNHQQGLVVIQLLSPHHIHALVSSLKQSPGPNQRLLYLRSAFYQEVIAAHGY